MTAQVKRFHLAKAICDSGISIAMCTSQSQCQRKLIVLLVVESGLVLHKLISLLVLLPQTM